MKYGVSAVFFLLAASGGGGGGPGNGDGDSDTTDSDTTTDDDRTTDDEGACTAGAHRCLTNTTLQTCQSDGTWGGDSPCPFTCYIDRCQGSCGPGSQACCVRYQNGTQGCSSNQIQQCYGTNCPAYSTPPGPVVSVYVATCNDMGELAESATCAACVTPLDGNGGTQNVASCNYCSSGGGSPVPVCDTSQGCNGCPQ